MAKYIDIKRFQTVCLKIYFYTVKKSVSLKITVFIYKSILSKFLTSYKISLLFIQRFYNKYFDILHNTIKLHIVLIIRFINNFLLNFSF